MKHFHFELGEDTPSSQRQREGQCLPLYPLTSVRQRGVIQIRLFQEDSRSVVKGGRGG